MPERPPTIVVEGLPPDNWDGRSLPVATEEQTNRALLCRQFGVADDASDDVVNAAIAEWAIDAADGGAK